MKPVGVVALTVAEKLETTYKRRSQGLTVLVARFAAVKRMSYVEHYNMAAAAEDKGEAAVHPSLRPTAIPGNRIPQGQCFDLLLAGPR